MQERAAKLIAFLKEIEKFKTVERRNWTINPKRRESDADHSWHLCTLILLMEKELKEKVDILHSLKLALTHDLVEIYAGDEMHFSKNKERARTEEEKAARKLSEQLPEDLGKQIYDLWQEYEDNATREAKLINALDKLAPVLSDLPVDGKTHKEQHVTYDMVLKDKKPHIESNKEHEILIEIYRQVLSEFEKIME